MRRLPLLRAGLILLMSLVAAVGIGTVLFNGADADQRRRTASFCQAAQLFVMGPLERVTAESAGRLTLEQMADLGPERLQGDLMVLARAKRGPPSDSERQAGARVGRYIERTCNINLSGIEGS